MVAQGADPVQLRSLSPSIDWPATMQGIGLPKIDTVIVGQPEFDEIEGILRSVLTEAWARL